MCQLESAWLALFSHVPQTFGQVQEKAAAVLAIVAVDPVQSDEDHAEMFLRSLVGAPS